MKSIVTAGILIGVLCGVWILVTGFAGWYKDPVLTNLFNVVILIEIGVLVWGLRKTAAEGRRYWGQVGAGTLMAAVGAVILFFVSILFTTVLFPDSLAETLAMTEEMYAARGMTEEQIEQAMAMLEKIQTPVIQASIGAFFTILTGFVASLIIAAFVRNK